MLIRPRRRGRRGLLAVFGLLCCAVLIGVAGRAEAAFPGRDGRVVWIEKELDEREGRDRFLVVQLPAPGEPASRVGDMDCLDSVGALYRTLVCPFFRPSFSPDGRAILLGVLRLLSGADGSPRRAELALADPDDRAAGTYPLPGLTDADREPACAPDGQRLVFVGRLGGVTDLFVAGVDGSGLRRLTFGGGVEREPVWSTEGEIAFERGQGLWSVQADGTGGLRRLTTKGRHPDWSPDGRRLIFERDRRLYTVSRAGGRAARLAGTGSYPAGSPSGRRVAFRYRSDIYTADPDGTDRKRVYNWLQSQGSTPARRYAPRDIDWGPRRR